MKAVIATASIALAIGFFAPGIAASDHGGHAVMQTQAPAAAQMVDGVIKKVDGVFTIVHFEPAK